MLARYSVSKFGTKRHKLLTMVENCSIFDYLLALTIPMTTIETVRKAIGYKMYLFRDRSSAPTPVFYVWTRPIRAHGIVYMPAQKVYSACDWRNLKECWATQRILDALRLVCTLYNKTTSSIFWLAARRRWNCCAPSGVQRGPQNPSIYIITQQICETTYFKQVNLSRTFRY